MIWLSSRTTQLFEVVGAIHLAQACNVQVDAEDAGHIGLLKAAGVHGTSNGVREVLPLGRAFVDTCKSEQSYFEVLVQAAGHSKCCLSPEKPIRLGPPATGTAQQRILLAPFALTNGVGINDKKVWPHVHNLLRTYGPVSLLSETREWLDNCPIAESEILSEMPMLDKLGYLSSAVLVVGVPNAWVWLAAACSVPTIVLYPDWQPQRRWFPYVSDKIGRASLTQRLEVPALLAGIRTLVSML